MNQFALRNSTHFERKYRKLIIKNPFLKKKIEICLNYLMENPFIDVLRTHRANTLFGEIWSSRVTGDLRIAWDFSLEEGNIILLFDIGGHSGRNKVYKHQFEY